MAAPGHTHTHKPTLTQGFLESGGSNTSRTQAMDMHGMQKLFEIVWVCVCCFFLLFHVRHRFPPLCLRTPHPGSKRFALGRERWRSDRSMVDHVARCVWSAFEYRCGVRSSLSPLYTSESCAIWYLVPSVRPTVAPSYTSCP